MFPNTTIISTTDPLPSSLRTARDRARSVEIFTGAGMSADSGLDTFRDAETGLWSHVDPQAMASIDSWREDPDPMWAWYQWREQCAREAQPHAGHKALARWGARDGVTMHTTTQNIDDLHERAGATNVAHLHGRLNEYRCSVCGKPAPGEEPPAHPVERLAPPRCVECGGTVRPSVVWFGEALPSKDWSEAEAAMNDADLVVIIGTSGVVYPAASLPTLAARRGTPIVEVSPAETDLTQLATWSIRANAAEGLPWLVDQ
ncbi:NAD-dependent deacylase [Corynebacterium parakroppenstedtii]|uniref:NAD-dependent deacylase n=1 Tax=Corynebacterium parakroppenstedtii TaxID=2828363 RepID=UPI0021AF9D28|nr:NAD-dependent deacylase [Corynebacterium parakroppenstedtii]